MQDAEKRLFKCPMLDINQIIACKMMSMLRTTQIKQQICQENGNVPN